MTFTESSEKFEHLSPSGLNLYDIYFRSLVALRNLAMLWSQTSVFLFATVIFIVVIIARILLFIIELREDQNENENSNDFSNTCSVAKKMLIHDIENALEELHQASDKCYSKSNFLKCVELTINWPILINISLPTSKGITPFHRVCYRGHYSLIDFMLTKGANLSQKTDSGETAFPMAIDYYIRNSSKKNFNCLDLLYSKGCFLKNEDEWYKQFVSDAIEAENEELVEWLASHTTPVSE